MSEINHYKYLEKYFQTIVENFGLNSRFVNNGLISAHGDKCYGYKDFWEERGIEFHHGATLYILSHTVLFQEDTRANIGEWVVRMYEEHENKLPKIDE